jgi:hypothetical protein
MRKYVYSRDSQLKVTRGPIFRKLKFSRPDQQKQKTRSFEVGNLNNVYVNGNNEFNTHDSMAQMIKRNGKKRMYLNSSV